jgi:hypothetical protein
MEHHQMEQFYQQWAIEERQNAEIQTILKDIRFYLILIIILLAMIVVAVIDTATK